MNIFGTIFLQFTSDVDYPMPFLHFQEFLLPEYHLSYYAILIKKVETKGGTEFLHGPISAFNRSPGIYR